MKVLEVSVFSCGSELMNLSCIFGTLQHALPEVHVFKHRDSKKLPTSDICGRFVLGRDVQSPFRMHRVLLLPLWRNCTRCADKLGALTRKASCSKEKRPEKDTSDCVRASGGTAVGYAQAHLVAVHEGLSESLSVLLTRVQVEV